MGRDQGQYYTPYGAQATPRMAPGTQDGSQFGMQAPDDYSAKAEHL